MYACARDHTLQVYEHDIVNIICGNFTKFTTYVQMGMKLNSSDFEVKCQGHAESKSGQKSTLGTLNAVCSDVTIRDKGTLVDSSLSSTIQLNYDYEC